MSYRVAGINVAQGERATIAHVAMSPWFGGEVIGEAHCHPDDKPDPQVGELLAVGRALERAGRRLVRRAEGLVKHAEDVRADRLRGGVITILIDRDTKNYPPLGARVTVTVEPRFWADHHRDREWAVRDRTVDGIAVAWFLSDDAEVYAREHADHLNEELGGWS